MPRWLLASILLTIAAGCNRQDSEGLSRIGRKVAVHAKNSAGDIGAKLDFSWAGKREPSLQEKIQDRLRFDSTLTEITFDVQVWDKEVVLKGTVKSATQKQRAIELAETVASVERVTDTIEVRDE